MCSLNDNIVFVIVLFLCASGLLFHGHYSGTKKMMGIDCPHQDYLDFTTLVMISQPFKITETIAETIATAFRAF